jgi:N-methylhydantoinase B
MSENPAVDPITLELVKNALGSIVDEMALTIVRTAYSANLKNSMDLSAALCDARGELVAQGLTLPLHLGSIPDAMAVVINRFGGDTHPGDVFILNDPYEGGTHLPDIYLIQPVFTGDRLAGYVCTIAHHTDIGGQTAGGNGCDATEIYQEGLRIPPLKLYNAGVRNEAIVAILARNVRIPIQVLGDLRAQLAACHIGEQGFLQLIERYGLEHLEAHFRHLLAYTERLARREIEAIPDGVYEFTDYIDDDGANWTDPGSSGDIPIRVEVTVRGDSLIVDFSGTSAQVKGGINSPLPFTQSTVYACARCLMDPAIPNNGGYFRPIEVRAPAGSLVNPVLPAPVAARGLTAFRVANALFGALSQALPEKAMACEVGGDTGVSIGGYDAEGQAFVLLEFLHGSWGAQAGHDGLDATASLVVNFSNNPIETMEAELPVRIEQYAFVPDTGGPGRYRGGLALVRDYRFLEEEATLQIRSDRRIHRAYGLQGGQAGTPSVNLLNPGSVERVLGSKVTLTIRRGDLFRHIVAGAGGFGDPLARDPQHVLRDVRDGKVTVAHARSAYGVVIDEGAMAIDEAATLRLRARLGVQQNA